MHSEPQKLPPGTTRAGKQNWPPRVRPGRRPLLSSFASWGLWRTLTAISIFAATAAPVAAEPPPPTRVFLRLAQDGDANLENVATGLESRILREGSGTIVFAGTTEMDAVFSQCREAVGVSASEERRCRLEAARRLSVEHVLEFSAAPTVADGGTTRFTLTVWDPETNAKLLVELRDASDEQLTAGTPANVLADAYLCFRGLLAACPEQKHLANATRDGWLVVRDIEPDTATVVVGGEAVGLGALERFDLPSGAVEVRLEAEGYAPHTISVILGPEEKMLLEGVRLDRLPCEAGDADACRDQCERGTPRACVRLGHMHARGIGEVQDHRAAARLFEQACEAEHADGCLQAALLAFATTGADDDIRARLQGLCDEGSARACYFLGLYRFEAEGDADGEVELLRQACDGGHARACRVLSDFASSGRAYRGGPYDALDDTQKKAYRGLRQRACELGDAIACTREDGSQERGRALFAKACAEGPGEQCYPHRFDRLALLGEQPLSRALAHCAESQASACLWAGWAYTPEGTRGSSLGRDLPGDEKRAFEAYRAAREHFTNACDEGSTNGCYEAAVLLREGHGGSIDIAGAFALFRSGCSGSVSGTPDADACYAVGELVEQGHGPRPGPTASSYFERACEGGHTPGCRRAGCASCSLRQDRTSWPAPGSLATLLGALALGGLAVGRRRG